MSSQLGELETEPGRFVAKEDFAANEEIMKNGFQSHDFPSPSEDEWVPFVQGRMNI